MSLSVKTKGHFLRETELYDPVKRFLEGQGFEVKAEIKDCDVVAKRPDMPPVIVELKTRFNLQLLYQGIDRLSLVELVYLAVPDRAGHLWKEEIKLCRRLGLGLLLVNGNWVEARIDPTPYTPRKNTKKIGRLLKEFQSRVGDHNKGGSTKRPVVTAYRQDVLRCAKIVGLELAKLSDIQEKSGVQKASSLLQRDAYGWFKRESRGVYMLSPKGRQALEDFKDVLAVL
jgi:hypothetical protein